MKKTILVQAISILVILILLILSLVNIFKVPYSKFVSVLLIIAGIMIGILAILVDKRYK